MAIYQSSHTGQEVDNAIDKIEDIDALIPAQASPSNQLADKDFVNSSIGTKTAYFLGTYNIVTDLGLTTSATREQIRGAIATTLANLGIIPTNDDYVFVAYPDPVQADQYTRFDRYKYNSDIISWEWEYTLNNSSFTAEQWAAINSGATSELIAKIGSTALTTTATNLSDAVNELESDKQDALSTQTAYASAGSATKVPQITTNSLGQVTNITEVTISSGSTYTAGTGIDITNDVISVDDTVVAMQSDLPDGELNVALNDSTTVVSSTVALNNIVAGSLTDGYTKYTITPGMSNPMTTQGDIILGGSSGTPGRLGIGTNGQVLTSNGTTASWQTPAASGMTNPMTTAGDIIVGGSGGTPARLGIGASGTVLTSNGTTASYAAIPTPDKLSYLTTAPSANNPDSGTIKIVILSSEPSTKYEGYLYIITASNAAPTLISFSINSTSYQAEQGMTWSQWVASAYNTGGFVVGGNDEYINSGVGGFYVADSSNSMVVPSDLIIADEQYSVIGGGSND